MTTSTDTPCLATQPSNPGLGHRHIQTLIMFFGFALAYALRTNLSIGIDAMSKPSHYKTFNFTPTEKGLILSSFFMGYTVLQVPAGILTRKYGSCLQLSLAIAFSGLITILTPLVADNFGSTGIIVTRILIGLAQGFLYPCVNQHVTRWLAPQERSRLFAFTFSGALFGSAVMLLLGGLLADGPGGWPAVFYFSGSVAIAWGILCYVFGYDSPSKHKYISAKERAYILNSSIELSEHDKVMVTPWKEIWSSLPVWALIITFTTNIWGFWTLLTLLPSYIDGVLHFNLGADGALSALPYIAMWLMSLTLSSISDILINRNILSQEKSRKLYNTISQYGPAICLMILGYVELDVVWAITILTLSAVFNSGMYIGYLMNPTDLSPNFTATLIGIANGISNISAILGPLISSYIVKDKGSLKEWQLVFTIAAVIYLVGSTFFLFFGSTQVQPWNQQRITSNNKSKSITKL